ncbi:PucR family transcriptional regulator [Pseudonocardia sp. GCM10023141]|uniref:PucR family transcriptional regulator n=1 Tax=Pseudonocardia sp. GCM10023141 TaxID=3252653 RepID=UPI003607028D
MGGVAGGVDGVVAEVARRLDAELPVLTVELTDFFVEVIPEFRHDDTVRRLMIASTSSNLVAIVDMLVHAIPLDRITVPGAAAEYARRFAQHDLSLEGLLRAYRLGEHRFVQWALRCLGELDLSTPDALAAAAEIAAHASRYIDQVIEGLIDIYESERRSWDSRTGAARAAQLRIVLENEGLTGRAAQDLIGLPMEGRHQAVVVWAGLDTAEPGRDLQAVSRLLQESSGRAPTTMLADDRTMWAWISGPAAPAPLLESLRELLELRPALRATLGAPGRGLPGFRATLREALRARTVVEAAPDVHPRVVAFDDVAVAALLTDQPADLRAWVERVLGDLAADDAGAARLRETVRVFLQSGGSFTEAAAQLHLHKNTVHYRVRKAEEIRGRPIGDDRLDVEVALLACAQLAGRIHPDA